MFALDSLWLVEIENYHLTDCRSEVRLVFNFVLRLCLTFGAEASCRHGQEEKMGRKFVKVFDARIFLIAAIVGIVALAGAPTVCADPPDAKQVTLSLSFDGSGSCSISVDPEVAEIWRGEHQKIKKVYWAASPNSQYSQLYWELRWDADKGGATEDYFGAVDLPCGVNNIKVQPKSKPKIANAEWPYAVAVYSCSDGAKSTHLCTVDPRIKWRD